MAKGEQPKAGSICGSKPGIRLSVKTSKNGKT